MSAPYDFWARIVDSGVRRMGEPVRYERKRTPSSLIFTVEDSGRNEDLDDDVDVDVDAEDDEEEEGLEEEEEEAVEESEDGGEDDVDGCC